MRFLWIFVHLEAFSLGLRDGYEAPYELSSGLTWANCDKNESYDHGVNIGQRIGAFVNAVREAWRAFIDNVSPQMVIEARDK
jgi:hypothetical protein